MSYSVFLKRSAQKELDNINEPTFQRIYTKILDLQNEPRPSGCKKLQVLESYRIRVGEFRVIYTIDDRSKSIEIIQIVNRKDAY